MIYLQYTTPSSYPSQKVPQVEWLSRALVLNITCICFEVDLKWTKVLPEVKIEYQDVTFLVEL